MGFLLYLSNSIFLLTLYIYIYMCVCVFILDKIKNNTYFQSSLAQKVLTLIEEDLQPYFVPVIQ